MALRKVYEEQLLSLHDELTQMSNLCAEAVQLAVQAVMTGDRELADRARESDDTVDKKERDIESLCLKLLLQQQPVAADLRRISSALKMISDLERIGDQAADIADISGYVTIREGTAAEDLQTMAAEVIDKVNESILSYVNNDLDLAVKVIEGDDIIDDWFDRIKKDLIAAIAADNTKGEYFLEILMVAKYLERIGDHVTNVAGWVEYSILGYHTTGEEPEG